MFRAVLILFLFSSALFTSPQVQAENRITKGEPILSWAWHKQFVPMIDHATDWRELEILGSSIGATVVAHQYDGAIYDHDGNSQLFNPDQTKLGSLLGSGGPGIVIALSQLYFDTDNGLAHARSLIFTSFSAYTTAVIAHRERPNHVNYLSFPSGHTSSAFTTATSLAYAYGPWVGVPAYILATYVGASRISDNAHWFSDTVMAAGLGIYWARASRLVLEDQSGKTAMIRPSLVPGGAMVSYEVGF